MEHLGQELILAKTMKFILVPMAALFCVFLPLHSKGEQADLLTSATLTKVGVIEQNIAVQFKPVSVYALVEVAPGKIKQYKALATSMNPAGGPLEAGQTVLVGAVLPIPESVDEGALFRFCFFLASIGGDFAATEVKSLTWKALRKSSLTADAIEQAIVTIETELPGIREASAKLETKLNSLKDQAAEIAEVDNLIDMKSEVDSLKGFEGKKSGEIERLRLLARAALQSPPNPDSGLVRMNLNQQLQLAARVTADASRLGMAKKLSAQSEYQRKIELVRQKEGLSVQALAQQVLALRKRRKELEARFNDSPSSPQDETEDF